MSQMNMIKLLLTRVETNGDVGREPVLGHHGKISDLCYGLLERLHNGDQAAIQEIAEVRLLDERVQRQREKSDQTRTLARGFQDGIFCLLGPAIDDHRDQIEAAIMKIELEKSVAK